MKTNLLSFSRPLRLAVGLLASLFATALIAQESPVVAHDSNAKHSYNSFLKKAAKAGHDEIAISTVAAARTSNAQVKAFANMIVSDHEGVAAKLATLAAAKHVELPAKELSAPKWEKKNANGFDKDYLKEMVDAHEGAVELFAKAAKDNDAEVAAFASHQLPTLQAHLTRAKELLNSLK
jgi:putative membrane protein